MGVGQVSPFTLCPSHHFILHIAVRLIFLNQCFVPVLSSNTFSYSHSLIQLNPVFYLTISLTHSVIWPSFALTFLLLLEYLFFFSVMQLKCYFFLEAFQNCSLNLTSCLCPLPKSLYFVILIQFE